MIGRCLQGTKEGRKPQLIKPEKHKGVSVLREIGEAGGAQGGYTTSLLRPSRIRENKCESTVEMMSPRVGQVSTSAKKRRVSQEDPENIWDFAG